MGAVARRQPLVKFVGERPLQVRRPIRKGVYARQRYPRGMPVGGEARQLEGPGFKGFGRDAENHLRDSAIERQRGVVRPELDWSVRASAFQERVLRQISHGALPSRGSHAT